MVVEKRKKERKERKKTPVVAGWGSHSVFGGVLLIMLLIQTRELEDASRPHSLSLRELLYISWVLWSTQKCFHNFTP